MPAHMRQVQCQPLQPPQRHILMPLSRYHYFVCMAERFDKCDNWDIVDKSELANIVGADNNMFVADTIEHSRNITK